MEGEQVDISQQEVEKFIQMSCKIKFAMINAISSCDVTDITNVQMRWIRQRLAMPK